MVVNVFSDTLVKMLLNFAANKVCTTEREREKYCLQPTFFQSTSYLVTLYLRSKTVAPATTFTSQVSFNFLLSFLCISNLICQCTVVSSISSQVEVEVKKMYLFFLK